MTGDPQKLLGKQQSIILIHRIILEMKGVANRSNADLALSKAKKTHINPR